MPHGIQERMRGEALVAGDDCLLQSILLHTGAKKGEGVRRRGVWSPRRVLFKM